MFGKDVIPKPDVNVFSSLSNPSTVGIHVTLQRIGYAQVLHDQDPRV